jgi:hypothetical protein
MKNPKCKKCNKEMKVGGGSPDFIGDTEGQTFYYYCECENKNTIIEEIMSEFDEKFGINVFGGADIGIYHLDRKETNSIKDFLSSSLIKLLDGLGQKETKELEAFGSEDKADTFVKGYNTAIKETNQTLLSLKEEIKKCIT